MLTSIPPDSNSIAGDIWYNSGAGYWFMSLLNDYETICIVNILELDIVLLLYILVFAFQLTDPFFARQQAFRRMLKMW